MHWPISQKVRVNTAAKHKDFWFITLLGFTDSSDPTNGEANELLIQNIFKRYRSNKPVDHLARRSDITADLLQPTSAPETPRHSRPSSFPNFNAR